MTSSKYESTHNAGCSQLRKIPQQQPQQWADRTNERFTHDERAPSARLGLGSVGVSTMPSLSAIRNLSAMLNLNHTRWKSRRSQDLEWKLWRKILKRRTSERRASERRERRERKRKVEGNENVGRSPFRVCGVHTVPAVPCIWAPERTVQVSRPNCALCASDHLISDDPCQRDVCPKGPASKHTHQVRELRFGL
jgi:hypothetical protein